MKSSSSISESDTNNKKWSAQWEQSLTITFRNRNTVETLSKTVSSRTNQSCTTWAQLCEWRQNRDNQRYHQDYNRMPFYSQIVSQFLRHKACRQHIARSPTQPLDIRAIQRLSNSFDPIDMRHKLEHQMARNISVPIHSQYLPEKLVI